MTIRDLLVHVDGAPAARARLEAALALAERFEGAHVTALYLIAEPFVRASGGAGLHVPEDLLREHLAHADAEADAALAEAREAAERRGVAFEAWREVGRLDRLPTMLAHHARHADLTVVGQPDPEAGGADDVLLAEAAFMDSGRPALLVPGAVATAPAAAPPRLPPRRALVAWDGSREAARAVGDALPLLRLAEEGVTVLVVNDRDLSRLQGEQPGAALAAHLARHAIAAVVRRVASERAAGVADTILAQAGEERADLLVVGGYGHSRLREMVLGGVTRHLIERATLPVLFSH